MGEVTNSDSPQLPSPFALGEADRAAILAAAQQHNDTLGVWTAAAVLQPERPSTGGQGKKNMSSDFLSRYTTPTGDDS